MFRFSIRELLLLTVLTATSLGWRIDRQGGDLAHKSTRGHAERLREALASAKWEYEFLLVVLEDPEKPRCVSQRRHVEWKLVDEPIP